MSKALIVFSGFNPRAVIAFLRTLEANDLNYGIIAKSQDDQILLTEYADKVLAIRTVPQLDINDLKSSIKKIQEQLDADEYIIAPSTEALNRFLLDNKKVITKLRCTLPLVNKKLYETISDKYSFGELCRSKGILVPKEFEDVQSILPPFVAKPKAYFSEGNQTHTPVLIFDENEKGRFLANFEKNDFYFQEYIQGESQYLLYYFYKNGDITKFSQNNLMQQPDGKSIVGAESADLHLSSQSHLYEDLFRSVTFRGLVMVEVKRMNDKLYMIEANPRFWGPSQLFVDAGVNLFEALLNDYGVLLERPSLDHKDNTKYFWHGGIRYTESEPQLTFYNYNKARLEANLKDWLAADVYKRNDTQKLYEDELRSTYDNPRRVN